MAVLRPASAKDTPGIHELIAGIFADYAYVLDVEQEDPHLRAPGAHFRDRGGEFWVVEQDGRIRASGAVLLHPDSAELKSLYVHRSLRRQGWGRRLTLAAIEHARQAGRQRVILWSDTRFEEAHRLYESLGFLRTGERHIDCTNSFSEYGYELWLD
ncbi:MAG: GNAT family N-acetyltransferase [Planctomycetes bacterium]|nr:GNAT family N-acetyltransferase [Planctomycetota bacterium]